MGYEFNCAICGESVGNNPQVTHCRECREIWADQLDTPQFRDMLRYEQDRRNEQRRDAYHRVVSLTDEILEALPPKGEWIPAWVVLPSSDDYNNALMLILLESGLTTPEKLALLAQIDGAYRAGGFSGEIGAEVLNTHLERPISAAAYRKHLSNAHRKISEYIDRVCGHNRPDRDRVVFRLSSLYNFLTKKG